MEILGFEIKRKAAVGVTTMPNNVTMGPAGSGWGNRILESFAGAWQRNVVVDSKECLLAFGAVTMIAADAAKLRIKLVEHIGATGIWREVGSSPYIAVLRRPNRYQTKVQFVESWMLSKLLHGNTYVLKERDERRIVVALYV